MFCRDRSYLWLVILLALSVAQALPAQSTNFAAPPDVGDPPPVWAQPLKGGPIRAAAVFPIDAGADGTALEQHLDLRLRVHFYGGEASFNDAVVATFGEKSDLLVVAGANLDTLADETRAALGAFIAQGGGLLWIAFAPDTTAELAAFLSPLGLARIEAVPDFASMAGGPALTGLQPGYDTIAAFGSTASRALEVRFWSARPHGHALIPLAPQDALRAPETRDNYVALVCHMVRWVARRDPETKLSAVAEVIPEGPVAAETPPQLPGRFVQRMQQASAPGVLRQFKATLAAPASRAYNLRVQVRYPGRGVSNSFEAAEVVRKGAQEIVFSVPAGAGDALLDVWLLDGSNVVDWFTQPVHLAAIPALTQFTVNASAVDPNDRIAITAIVEGRLEAGQPRTAGSQIPLALFLRVTDSYGREVARTVSAAPATGGEIKAEVALIDLLAPYARLDVFASFAAEPSLDWWTRARADHRMADLLVHQPAPQGLALIVDDPGEGSFAGSTRRRALAEDGVTYVAPGVVPMLGNIAADGLRIVADLGEIAQFPGNELGPRTHSGAALRQAAAPYAALQPRLYVASADSNADPATLESIRGAMQRVVRESDRHAALGLLVDGYSARDSGGFRVLPADPAVLPSINPSSALYTAIRAALPENDRALEQSRWLPWFAALHRADALWIDNRDAAPDSFAALAAETRRVGEGFDVLFYRATPSASTTLGALTVASDFSGFVGRYTLGKAELVALLSDPRGNEKNEAKLKAEGSARIYDLTSTEPPRASKNHTIKVRAGEVAAAAILPYEVSRVAIEMPGGVAAGRRLTLNVSVKTRGVLPGDHVLRMTIADPAGRALEHYSRTIFAPNGQGSAWVPFAFNDVPGNYRVTVRDLLTRVETTADLSVVVPQESDPDELQ